MNILGSPIFCLCCFNFLPKTAKASHKLPTSNTNFIIKKQRLNKNWSRIGASRCWSTSYKGCADFKLGWWMVQQLSWWWKLAVSTAGSRLMSIWRWNPRSEAQNFGGILPKMELCDVNRKPPELSKRIGGLGLKTSATVWENFDSSFLKICGFQGFKVSIFVSLFRSLFGAPLYPRCWWTNSSFWRSRKR